MPLQTSGSPRRPALWAGTAAAIGIWLIGCGSAYPWLVGLAGAISLVLVTASIRFSRCRGLWLYLLIGCAAAAHLLALNLWRPSHDLKYHAESDAPVILYGTVSAEPDVRPHVTLVTLAADSINYGDSAVPRRGGVFLRLPPEISMHYGEYLVLRGNLEPISRARNPGEFDFAAYMARRDIFVELVGDNGPLIVGRDPKVAAGWTATIVAPLRAWILDCVRRHIHGDPAALVMGLMFGERKQLKRDTLRQFQDTGTLHLLAVSGSNVAVVIGVVWGMLSLFRTPRTARTVITLFALVLFCALSRNQPSVVRASVAAGLVLIGHARHRRIDPLNIWGGSLLIILLASPGQLFDVGFQLSFAAALAIIVFAPTFARWPSGHSWPRRLARITVAAIGVSMAAQLAVTPILASTFNRVPSVTPLSNLACVPIAGLATASGLVTLVAAPLGDSVLTVMAGPTWLFAKLLLSAVTFFDRLGMPLLEIATPAPWSVVLYYAAVGLLIAWILRPQWWRRVIFGIILVAHCGLWPAVSARTTQPEIIVLDCGPAAVSLIRWPHGDVWLVEQEASRRINHFTRVVEPFINRFGWEDPSTLWLLDGEKNLSRMLHLWPTAKRAEPNPAEPHDSLTHIQYAVESIFRVRALITSTGKSIAAVSIAGTRGQIIWAAPGTDVATLIATADTARALCLVTPHLTSDHPYTSPGQRFLTKIASTYSDQPRSLDSRRGDAQSLSTLSSGGIRIWGLTDSVWTESSIR